MPGMHCCSFIRWSENSITRSPVIAFTFNTSTVRLYVCLSVCTCYLSVFASVSSSICLTLSVRFSVCLSVHHFVYLSV
jgi:hypothetical protein